MVWHALLQSMNAPLLALIPTTLDRVVVWGALALVIGLIAWREYTLPDVSPPMPAPDPKPRSDLPSASVPGVGRPPLPGIAPAETLLPATEPRPVVSPVDG